MSTLLRLGIQPFQVILLYNKFILFAYPSFLLKQYPLVSKCGYIGRLELQPSISNEYEIKLENFPGGSEIFEVILKFCYGLPIDLNPNNIVALRCASEFLEMSEELEDGNLMSKTQAFLTFVILSSWKDTITVLKSCEALSPWAENLQIIRICCDSVAWKASRENSLMADIVDEGGSLFDDVATLRIDHFMRIITAIRAKEARPEIIGKCIMCYAARWLPGMNIESEGLRSYGYGKTELQYSILSGRNEDEGLGHNNEKKTIIESLVSLLPPQREAVPCKFLLKMLKMAIVYSASPSLIVELEKRVGLTLENTSVNDLLIPRTPHAAPWKLGLLHRGVTNTTGTSPSCLLIPNPFFLLPVKPMLFPFTSSITLDLFCLFILSSSSSSSPTIINGNISGDI